MRSLQVEIVNTWYLLIGILWEIRDQAGIIVKHLAKLLPHPSRFKCRIETNLFVINGMLSISSIIKKYIHGFILT